MLIRLLLLCLLSTAARAGPVPDRMEHPLILIDQGVICDHPPGASPDLWLFDSRSTVVPIRRGVAFGFTARVAQGTPPVTLTFSGTHPPITADGTTQTRFARRFTADGVNGALFVFEVPNEEREGDWIFRLQDDAGRILYEQTFTTVPPEQASHVCPAPPATS